MSDFLTAIGAYGKALRLISRLGLWGYFVVPGLLSFAVGGGFLVLVILFGDDIGDWFVSFYPYEAGSAIAAWLLWLLGYIALVLLAILLFKAAIGILLSPFLSKLSERVEVHLRGDRPFAAAELPQGQVGSFVRGARFSVRMLAREVVALVVFLPLGLIPIVGVAASPLLLLLQSYFIGAGNADATLERHFKYKESIAFNRRHRGLSIGNGLVNVLLLFVPVLGFIFAPALSTVASTIAVHRALEREKKVPQY